MNLATISVKSRCEECEQQVGADGTYDSLYSPHGGSGLEQYMIIKTVSTIRIV